MELSDYKNPLEVVDFSGGLTDNLYWQDTKRSRQLDNLLIKSDRSLEDRPGSVIDDLANPQIPAGVQRIGALINYNNNDKLFVQSARKLYYRNPSAYATLTGPTGNDVLSAGDTSKFLSFSQWNGHIYLTSDAYPSPQKIYKDETGAYQVRSSGLPALATSPAIAVGGVGANDYIYSFAYDYSYSVGTPSGSELFEDIGPVTQVRVTASDDPGTTPNAITGIPVLSNGATDNWETSDIRVFIYRTVGNGQQSYLIGSVLNGTTIFTDNIADSAIQTNDRLYTDDGSLDYDPPPKSRYVHVVSSTGYYGVIFENGEEKKYTVRQSIPGAPDKVPAAFDIPVEDFVQGVSSARSNPIILCKKYIYRVDGFFDNFGVGAPLAVRISDTAGCVSFRSIVQAENGIFWFGNDGVYFTDGYQTMKVSDGNNDRYQNLLAIISDARKIEGRFDEKERRIYWTVQSSSSNNDNDSLFILELRWGISTDMPFETASGASFRPSAIEFFNKQLMRADTRGFVFKHDPIYTTDPKVDITASPSVWNRETIIWTHESVNLNFGNTHLRKYVTKMLLTAANIDNTSIQIVATNDDGRLVRYLKQIRWRRNFVWGDEEFVWGNPDCAWDAVGIIEQIRRMPAKGLRLSYLRVLITNALSVVVNSDHAGEAVFDKATKTAVLVDYPSQVWPADSVDYYVTTEVDNYTNEYLVTARTNSTLTVLDPGSTFPTGQFKWELLGYKKGESLNLLSYDLIWDFASQSQMTFESGQDGGNS